MSESLYDAVYIQKITLNCPFSRKKIIGNNDQFIVQLRYLSLHDIEIKRGRKVTWKKERRKRYELQVTIFFFFLTRLIDS